MSAKSFAARNVPPGERWTFEHRSLAEVIRDEDGAGGAPPASRPGDVDAVFLALKEIAFAAAQVAEALSYARLADRDPKRNLRQAQQHLDCALANLKLALR